MLVPDKLSTITIYTYQQVFTVSLPIFYFRKLIATCIPLCVTPKSEPVARANRTTGKNLKSEKDLGDLTQQVGQNDR